MPAAERTFVDTDVLLYSVDSSNTAKQIRAREWIAGLWETGAGRLSWQVLNEFYANAVRKTGAKEPLARATVEAFATWQPIEQSLILTQRAWYWADNAQLSYGDGLILAAAERAGCKWLLSEDFPSGRQFGAVVVLHPFQNKP